MLPSVAIAKASVAIAAPHLFCGDWQNRFGMRMIILAIITLSHVFPLKSSPTLSDRNIGFISAATSLGIFNMHCVRHIIGTCNIVLFRHDLDIYDITDLWRVDFSTLGNMGSGKTLRLAISHDTFVWAANAATTEAAFNDAITKLGQVSTSAATYLRAIPAAKWALYPQFKVIPLYGWRTTNFVESEQAKSLRLKPRLMLPFEFFKAYGTILMGETYYRSKQLKTWVDKGRRITPRAEMEFQTRLKVAEEYSAVFSSDDVAFVARVTYPLKRRRVDTVTPECSCVTWMQLKVPCRHILAALTGPESPPVISDLVSDCYKVTTFEDTVGSLEIPE
uniref:AlNc14C422G11540 protein n=1 Tax=Albugo laibachii Nc14 TaxID=890382 RepID=F0WZD8_9STRA|nr:AlNc14C422G11540 [Albugo laibachii Nc14]|eukprot:CCA26858.1 AlNc14C422G11540 [Albugo laibachii Nc14]